MSVALLYMNVSIGCVLETTVCIRLTVSITGSWLRVIAPDVLTSAAPRHCTYACNVDGLVLQGVAGRGVAARVLLEHGYPQGDGHGLQAGQAVQPLARVAGVAVGLVDDLRNPVEVNVLPVETINEQYINDQLPVNNQ